MEQNEITKELLGISQKLYSESSSKAFVSRDVIISIAENLDKLRSEILASWVHIWKYIKNWVEYCWNCNQKVSKMRVRFNSPMLRAVIKAFNYAVKNNRQIINISDLNLWNSEYSQFNHVVRFWLAYKTEDMKGWEYWIPRKRIYDFLQWEFLVAEYFLQDPLKKEWEEWRRTMSDNRISVNEVPSVEALKRQFWERLTEYEWNNDFE